MRVRLTQLDGKLPNLALMKLAHWHRAQGDELVFSRNVRPSMFEKPYDRVYGSAIFTFSKPLVEKFKEEFPGAIVSGTALATRKVGMDGVERWDFDDHLTVEQHLGITPYENYDYSFYPKFTGSIGFTMRGCSQACGFCQVPQKEGKPRPVNSVYDIWRGEGHAKHLHLLDNDFFGQPFKNWNQRVDEILGGGFKVCFNQGINIRMITKTSAPILAKLPCYDDQFKDRRIYMAWDNLEDEDRFFVGVQRLIDAGVKAHYIMVYMLIGYDEAETWERIFYRFNKMVGIGIRPYPMVYNNARPDLKLFQKWVVRRYCELVPWEEFVASKGHIEGLHEAAKGLDATGEIIGRKRTRRAELLAEHTISLFDDWNIA